MNRAQQNVRRACLADATKAQEISAYCYERGQALAATGEGGQAQFQRDAAYWSQRARMFLFQTIGDSSSEDECFDNSLGEWS